MEQQRSTEPHWSNAKRMSRGSIHGLMAGAGIGRQEILTRAFTDEVVPRLLAARRQAAPAGAAPQAADAGQVERLLALVLTGTQAEAADYVALLRNEGLPTASILLDLLTPVARHLGCMWEDDTCSFSDVTIGIGRLMHVLRTVSASDDAMGFQAGDFQPGGFQPGGLQPGDFQPGGLQPGCLQSGPTALLVQMPGEPHGLGLSMVVHFFRQGGWSVRQAPSVTSAGLVGLVRKEWFGIVGVSVACSSSLDTLAGDIRAIRKHARNRDIGVMVGGPPFLAHPQLADMVGADATAVDGQQALREAHRLVGMRARGQ